MPSIAQIPQSNLITNSPLALKKRKREQFIYGDGEDYAKLSSIHNTSTNPHSRSLSTTSHQEVTSISHSSIAPRLIVRPRSLKAFRPHETKRQRILSPESAKTQDPSNNSYMLREQDMYQAIGSSLPGFQDTITGRSEDSAAARPQAYTRTLLSPCHICHQKPKVRTDLDSYADCQWCGKRTCYICMRECAGPLDAAVWEGEELEHEGGGMGEGDFEAEGVDAWEVDGEGNEALLRRRQWGHKGMICSQCCVERGLDGEVRCLGCMRAEEEREGNS